MSGRWWRRDPKHPFQRWGWRLSSKRPGAVVYESLGWWRGNAWDKNGVASFLRLSEEKIKRAVERWLKRHTHAGGKSKPRKAAPGEGTKHAYPVDTPKEMGQ